jgi:hypothetical protein
MGLLKKFFDHFSKRTSKDEVIVEDSARSNGSYKRVTPSPPYAWPRTTTHDLRARQKRKRKRKHQKRGKR